MITTLKSIFYKIKYFFNDRTNKKYKYDNKIKDYNNIRQFSTPCTFYQQDFYDDSQYFYKRRK